MKETVTPLFPSDINVELPTSSFAGDIDTSTASWIAADHIAHAFPAQVSSEGYIYFFSVFFCLPFPSVSRTHAHSH